MDEWPSGRRVVLGFAAAALAAVAAAIAFFAADAPPDGRGSMALLILIFGLPIALLHVLLLAAPAYALLRERWPLRWWNAALAGFLVGAVPIFLLSLSPGPAVAAGIFGLAGGLAFRAVMPDGGEAAPDRG